MMPVPKRSKPKCCNSCVSNFRHSTSSKYRDVISTMPMAKNCWPNTVRRTMTASGDLLNRNTMHCRRCLVCWNIWSTCLPFISSNAVWSWCSRQSLRTCWLVRSVASKQPVPNRFHDRVFVLFMQIGRCGQHSSPGTAIANDLPYVHQEPCIAVRIAQQLHHVHWKAHTARPHPSADVWHRRNSSYPRVRSGANQHRHTTGSHTTHAAARFQQCWSPEQIDHGRAARFQHTNGGNSYQSHGAAEKVSAYGGAVANGTSAFW